MRKNKDDLVQEPVPSRFISTWAGISLSTYKKIIPWINIKKNDTNSCVAIGGAYIALEFSASNSIIDPVEKVARKIFRR